MFCPQCGHQNPDAAKFCMQCGYNYVGGGANYAPHTSSAPPHQAPPQVIVKRGGGLAVVLLLLVLVGGGLGVFLLLNSGVLVRQKDWLGRDKPIVDVKASDKEISGKLNLPEVQQRRAPVRQPDPPPPPSPPAYDNSPTRPAGGGVPLVNEIFSVPAGTVKWWRFTVPEGMTCRVAGEFRARGGGGNDIEVNITDENGANGHAGRFWYQSGKMTTGNIDVQLGPGTYYIVFSNRFSLFSQKNVSASINTVLQ
jgi:zinc-ribbon domain